MGKYTRRYTIENALGVTPRKASASDNLAPPHSDKFTPLSMIFWIDCKWIYFQYASGFGRRKTAFLALYFQ